MSQHLAASYNNSNWGPTIVAVHDDGYIDMGSVIQGRFTWMNAMVQTYLPGSPTLNTLLYNQENSMFVAGDDQGGIWVADGNNLNNWNNVNPSWNHCKSVKAIAYGKRSTDGKGVFVASGDMLTYPTLHSSDGQNWWPANPNLSVGLTINDIIFANGIFVAVGMYLEWSGIYYSIDGVNWTAQYLNGTATFSAITYANNLFVAVAQSSTIWYSSDGKNWTIATGLSGEANFKDVTYANNTFVAVADYGTIWWSSDGKQWTIANEIPPDGPDITFNKVAFGAGQFVAVADVGNQEVIPIYYSPDGKNWSQGQHIYYDGITWGYPRFYDVIYANNTFYAIERYPYLMPNGDTSAWPPYSSTDGVTWDRNYYSY